jgi:hypothetical protein
VRPSVVPAITCDGVEATVVVDRVPVSFIFRVSGPSGLCPLYFSLVDCSLVLTDKRGCLKRVLAVTRSYMELLGYEKIAKGTGWYWRPAVPVARKHLRALGFDKKGRWAEQCAREYLTRARASFAVGDLDLTGVLLRQSIAYLVKAKLAFCGVEPVKCDRWEPVILRREAYLPSSAPDLGRPAPVFALSAVGLESREGREDLCPAEARSCIQGLVSSAEQVVRQLRGREQS